MGEGEGKGKGGRGVYGLDFMGNSSWGGDDYYYDNSYDYGLSSIDTTYGCTLAAFEPAPIAISDRYGSIAEESGTAAIDVPITDLIKQKPRKLRKQTGNITKKTVAHPSICESCPTGGVRRV